MKSAFTFTSTTTDDAYTSILSSPPTEYYDYIIAYDGDRTDANTDGTLTWWLWNKSGSGEYEKQEHEEGMSYTTNNDSASRSYWLDAQQLWRTTDSDSYYLTDFFSTEKKWSASLSPASDFDLSGATLRAKTWYVRSWISPQTDEKKNSYLLNSWDDGTTTFTYTAPDGKWFDDLDIPFTAKWALVTWQDAAVGGTETYQVDKF